MKRSKVRGALGAGPLAKVGTGRRQRVQSYDMYVCIIYVDECTAIVQGCVLWEVSLADMMVVVDGKTFGIELDLGRSHGHWIGLDACLSIRSHDKHDINN